MLYQASSQILIFLPLVSQISFQVKSILLNLVLQIALAQTSRPNLSVTRQTSPMAFFQSGLAQWLVRSTTLPTESSAGRVSNTNEGMPVSSSSGAP